MSLLTKYSKRARAQVQKWLQKQDAYTIHKPIIRKFPRNKYIVSNIFELWQADLCDMRNLSNYNDGINYILRVIDVFSKKAWAMPLKHKTSTEVINAFKQVFDASGHTPKHLQTDKGKDFLAQPVQRFFNEHNINFYVANNPDVKAAGVERFNRTLKMYMFRYFTYANSRRYVDVLNSLLDGYNNRHRSSIKMAPNEVNHKNVFEVWNNLYRKGVGLMRKPRFKENQLVRISRSKNIFEKGYANNWSDEIFKITKVINRRPPVYRILDLNNESVEGTFYEEELQPVSVDSNSLFKIEKVLGEKGQGKNKKYLVKWLGYSDKFNSWVPATDIKQI
ncbi:hypothetical protein ILUMI_20333 [Ignelater luminosus]|uniref:Integrase catalytic domain-containing protein n=1 Tax=Ignelater luminosus TaxID=2038154 RepID=A0A8K0FZ11_IGNLU|nr:hypothetical protein ILUMI_20333 [Ignelater luminosus]